ncbi:zinc finger protein 862-like [Mercenaria mercenaria]|nr:zinc finger protein 862-like [Mercenaria mercenaria]
MKYLKLEQPENTKATGILEAINKAFTEFDLQDYKQKTVGFCSDGASVMMGSRRGVITLMKEEGNADWILSVWCLAHRLELAVKDSFKGTYMDKVIEMLVSIYQFYKCSAKRNKEANDIADLLGEHFLKPEKANGTRWVNHKLKAVTKLLKNWPIIVTQMENYAEDNSNKAEDRARVRGYLIMLKQHKMLRYIAFVKDVLNEVAKISLLFQREDITVYSAVTKLQSAEGTLRQMFDNDGPAVTELQHEIQDNQYRGHTLLNMLAEDCHSLITDRQRIVQSVIDCIAARFDNIVSESIYLACNAFDHKNWPLPNERAALLLYGVEDVRVVYRHFSTVLQNADCDLVNALSQWNDLKIHVANTARYATMHPLLVWQMISQEDSDKGDYKDILKVIHLTSVYPLSNASCERAFSTMKRIKTDWRCNLNVDMMDILMRISVTNVKFNDFNPRPAVRRWWLSGQRQKRPNILPYGHRN